MNLDADKAAKAGASHLILNGVILPGRMRPLCGKDVIFSVSLYYDQLPDYRRAYDAPGPQISIRFANKKGLIKGADRGFSLRWKGLAAEGYVAASQISGQWITLEKRFTLPPDATGCWVKIVMGTRLAGTKNLNSTTLYIDDVRLEIADK